MRPHIHFLVHFKSKFKFNLQLEFASKLVFELPYRVANTELLVVEVEDAYYMRQCSLNSLIRSIIDRASLFFYSFLIRSTSSAPAKLEEIGLITYTKLQYSLNPYTSRSFNYSASLQTFLQLFSHLSIFYFLLQTFRAVYQLRTLCFQPKVVGASAFFSALSRSYTILRPSISKRQATNVIHTIQLLMSLIAYSYF